MSIFNLERTEDADELIRFVRGSESAAVRARAADALGEIRATDDGVVEVPERTVLDDPDDADTQERTLAAPSRSGGI